MSPPWQRPEGWSELACEIAWHDWHSRLDHDTCDGVVLSVIDWSPLRSIRERLSDLPGVTDNDLSAALRQIGCVVATVDECIWLRRCAGLEDDGSFWSWPDAETAMRAWRAVGALVDERPRPTGLIDAARMMLAHAEGAMLMLEGTEDEEDIAAFGRALRALQAELERLDLLDAEALR